MSENDVICTGAKECLKLPKDTTHTFEYGGGKITTRPSYCSGQYPHISGREEMGPMFCNFVNHEVKKVSVWKRAYNSDR